MEGVLAYIALGTNLGERARHLHAALFGLEKAPGMTILRCSPIYETAARTLDPLERQPCYLNAVIEVNSILAPADALAVCRNLERIAGRTRHRPWAPRTLDLDLLTLGSYQCSVPGLNLPHPRLATRRFVLQPWADLSPNHYIGNPLFATVSDLLKRCTDTGAIRLTALGWQETYP